MVIFPKLYTLWKYGYFIIFFDKKRSPYVFHCTEMNLLLYYLVIEIQPSFFMVTTALLLSVIRDLLSNFQEVLKKIILHTSGVLVAGNKIITFNIALTPLLYMYIMHNSSLSAECKLLFKA